MIIEPKNFSIQSKTTFFIFLSFLLVSVNVSVGFFWIYQINNITHSVEQFNELLNKNQNFRLSVQRLVMPANDFLITGSDNTEQENFYKLLNEAKTTHADLVHASMNNEFISEHMAEEVRNDRVYITHTEMEQILELIESSSTQIFSTQNAKQDPLAGKIMEKMDQEANDITEKLTENIEHLKMERDELFEEMKETGKIAAVIITLFLLLSIALLFFIHHAIKRFIVFPLLDLSKTVEDMKNGDLSVRSNLSGNDEIGKLSTSFNNMAAELQSSYTTLEQKVTEKTAALNEKIKESETNNADLNKINELMIGRELKMVELKEEINRLKEKLKETQ